MSQPNKFSDLIDSLSQPRTVTPREAAHAAAASLQTSLFGRLRATRGGVAAGRLAWMLVRLGQPEHPDSPAAYEAIQTVGVGDLKAWVIVCRGARDKLGGAGAGLAGIVVEALEAEVGRRG